MPNENVEKVCLSEMSKLCQQLETKCHILKTFVVDFYFLVHRKVCCFMWELQKSVKRYILCMLYINKVLQYFMVITAASNSL